MSKNGTAKISECGIYRYELTRDGLSLGDDTCAFIMLNPSTADAKQDDPTIRRCIGFARGWGFRELRIYNLFALRSPNPRDLIDSLEAGIDPVGPENRATIAAGVANCKRIVCAWGAFKHPMVRREAETIQTFLREANMCCLGFTADGSPKHPLYVRADTSLHTFPRSHP